MFKPNLKDQYSYSFLSFNDYFCVGKEKVEFWTEFHLVLTQLKAWNL
jgi:hypothetical protein